MTQAPIHPDVRFVIPQAVEIACNADHTQGTPGHLQRLGRRLQPHACDELLGHDASGGSAIVAELPCIPALDRHPKRSEEVRRHHVHGRLMLRTDDANIDHPRTGGGNHRAAVAHLFLHRDDLRWKQE